MTCGSSDKLLHFLTLSYTSGNGFIGLLFYETPHLLRFGFLQPAQAPITSFRVEIDGVKK